MLAWAGGEGAAEALLVTGAAVHGDARVGQATPPLAVVPAGALARPEELVPMAGSWSEDGGDLRFVPSLPFAHGVTYVLVRADAAPAAGSHWIEVDRIERATARAAPSARVLSIDPDVDDVPENLLRLSVTFTAPMDEGSAAGNIHLALPGGSRLEQALLPMPPELWDRARQRLTLLLEPGRIKRGLVPHRALGAPLERIPAFDLVVGAAMRDALGAPLVSGSRRRYRVGPAARTRLDPRAWTVSWPAPHSVTPLVVDFDRAVDRTLVLRCLVVRDDHGAVVRGRTRIERGQMRWSFLPDDPWPAAGLALHVDPALEDLAGNSVRRVFDRDLRLGDRGISHDAVVLRPVDPADGPASGD